jgi:hypothetical protein
MNRDPFVMQSIARARRWVELCSEGMAISPEESAQILAGLCGFGSWDVMTYGIETLPPSIPDEHLAPEQYMERLVGQMEILVGQFDFDAPDIIELLRNLSPSSDRPFNQFEAEVSDNPANVQMEMLRSHVFETYGLHDEEDRETEQVESFIPPIDPIREGVAAVLGRDPGHMKWMGIFACLGWECEIRLEAPGIDEPSYLVHDSELGTVPVYVAPAVFPPRLDEGDPLFPVRRLIRTICVGDHAASNEYTSSVALLLLQRPLVKEIEGLVYCHLGSAYLASEKKWINLLFNTACTSVSKLLDLNRQLTDIDQGAVWLADIDRELSNIATLFLSGLSLEEFDQLPGDVDFEIICGLFDETGWMLQRIDF